MGIEAVRSASLSLYCIKRGFPAYTAFYGGLSSFERRMERRRLRRPASAARKALALLAVRTLPIPGGRINLPMSDEEDVMASLFQTFVSKEYEVDPRYVPRPGQVVIDAGGFVGLWTIRVAALVGGSGRVITVEPNPVTLPQLEANLRLNRLHNVTLVRGALGSTAGAADLFYPVAGSGSASSSLFEVHTESVVGMLDGRPENIARTHTKVTTIDEVIREQAPGRVDLLKIDVEGAEVSVLEGSRGSFRRGTVRKVIVEVHEDVCSVGEVTRLLEDCGFVIDRVERTTMETGAWRALVLARRDSNDGDTNSNATA